MAIIILNDFDAQVKIAEAEQSPAPAGRYKLQIKSCDGTAISKTGNPQAIISMEIIQSVDPLLNGKKITEWCPLEREDGSWPMSFKLVNLLQAVNRPYVAGQWDDQSCVNGICDVNLIVDEKFNSNKIQSFVKG